MDNFDNRAGGKRPSFQAICSRCKKVCQIPFQPKGDRPVFCSDCFKERNRGPKQDKPRMPGGQPNFDQFRGQLETLNSKLDKILRLLTPAVSPAPASVVAAKAEKKPAKPVKKEKKSVAKKKK